jgi:hypothetical protein
MTEHEFDPDRDEAAKAYERYVLNYRTRHQQSETNSKPAGERK